MKVRREILIIFSMILLLVLPAMSLGKEIKWVLERPVIPVLVKKPASPVLKVTLIRADNQPYSTHSLMVLTKQKLGRIIHLAQPILTHFINP